MTYDQAKEELTLLTSEIISEFVTKKLYEYNQFNSIMLSEKLQPKFIEWLIKLGYEKYDVPFLFNEKGYKKTILNVASKNILEMKIEFTSKLVYIHTSSVEEEITDGWE